MVKPLFDTNILIDYLNAIPEAADELDRYDAGAISIVTWMEVMVGAKPEWEADTKAFLEGFELVAVTEQVAERAVELRRANCCKLPDAIVWASAQVHGKLLVSRNSKDFPAGDPGVRVPYQL